MGQATLVSHQIDDVPRLVAELRSDQFDVKAAFWLSTSEAGQWYFYLVSGEVDEGLAEAYGRLNKTMDRLPDLWIDSFDVKLISPSDPIAKAVMAYPLKKNSSIPTRAQGIRLRNDYVEDGFIYPV